LSGLFRQTIPLPRRDLRHFPSLSNQSCCGCGRPAS